jgi:CHAD domain-containing protein
MAFRLKRGEPVQQAIKRMARGELDEAQGALGRYIDGKNGGAARRDGDGIHDARTALKKARALLRLVEPEAGRSARAAYDELRDVGRKLSPVRDAAVLVATFDRVRRLAGHRRDPDLTEARAALEKLLHEREAGFRAADRRAAVALLARARREVDRCVPDDDRWSTLGRGLVDVYRRGRRRMRAAYAEDTSTAFHAWRRVVKSHRYQMQALEPLWPTEIGAQRQDLEKLGDLLGEEHDLAVLADALRDERTCFADSDVCNHFLATLERRQSELRSLARPLGERLFAEKASDWGRRHRAYFDTFRSEQPGTGGEAMAATPA